MTRCQQCGTKIRSTVNYTPTGRALCGNCHAQFSGAAVGVMGGLAGAGNPVGSAMAGVGALAWIRRFFGKDREDEAPRVQAAEVETTADKGAEKPAEKPAQPTEPPGGASGSW